MYIRLLENDREILSLGCFEQRPMAGDTVVVEDKTYRVLNQPGRFEKLTLMVGRAVWMLALQVSPIG
ncbi:MAG: hypothetical protein ACM359_09465 [Bacillota bacterium]